MKIIFAGGEIVNVFTDSLVKANVVVEDGIITGVGDYYVPDESYDEVVDITGKIMCPGFIDSHIHIESTMLSPAELAKALIVHGTTGIVADPHEIANVCGMTGTEYMLKATENLPLSVYIMASSCVPAVPLDESAATLTADELAPLYRYERVLGLAEMMNYPGVLAQDDDIRQKIDDAKAVGGRVNGHAPLVTGAGLDKYISFGVEDDHECSDINEAIAKLERGMHILIRQGTAAKNLKALIDLFDAPYSYRCLLCTDDKSAADIIATGHIDSIIRESVSMGKSVCAGIRMATIQPAQYYGLTGLGAIAPGYKADILIMSDIDTLHVEDVYRDGRKVCEDGRVLPFAGPQVDENILKRVSSSVNVAKCDKSLFDLGVKGQCKCRVIEAIPESLLTNEVILDVDFSNGSGIDIERDILKVAVLERHNGTGHTGIGFIHGLGLKEGALASTVSHDSHNIIVIGTNEEDMSTCVNELIDMQGGMVVVRDGRILASLPLPIGGLMSNDTVYRVADQNTSLSIAAKQLGAAEGIDPFMNTAFLSLSVIPHLKITSRGLLDVDAQEIKNVIYE